MKKYTIIGTAVACVLAFNTSVFARDHWKELRELPFPENYPTRETTARLHDEVQFQRACQVVTRSLPAMALWAMKKGSEKQFGEGSNVFPIWKDRLSAETIVSTPNSDVIYGMGYLELKKDGPTVIEVPPKLQGILDDFWHRPLTDVGFVGPDKGEGGKYLILPPAFEGKAPEGYSKELTFKSSTYNVFVFWRAFRDEDGGTKEGVALMEQTRIYPLAKADNPPAMKFPNGTGKPADMLFPQDYRYFEGLAEFVEHEFVGPEDWSMRGMMASLGIVKGKPFAPDARMKKILAAGADVGMKMAQAIRHGDILPNTLYYKDRQWHNVLNVLDVEFKQETYIDIAVSDGRTIDEDGRCKTPVKNTVDIADASYTNTSGDPLLGAHWIDPDFDPKQPAFYYVRVLEIPTPRWTAHDAKFFKIKMPPETKMELQDRAYTSPIW